MYGGLSSPGKLCAIIVIDRLILSPYNIFLKNIFIANYKRHKPSK